MRASVQAKIPALRGLGAKIFAEGTSGYLNYKRVCLRIYAFYVCTYTLFTYAIRRKIRVRVYGICACAYTLYARARIRYMRVRG